MLTERIFERYLSPLMRQSVEQADIAKAFTDDDWTTETAIVRFEILLENLRHSGQLLREFAQELSLDLKDL